MKRVLMHIAAAAAVILSAAAPVQVGAQPRNPHIYTNPTGGEFPVMAWYSLLGEQVTAERYRELADAGFNLSFSHFARADDVAAALKAARGTGVKILITCAELADDPEATVRRFRRDKANAGYFLRDEPICDAFPELVAWAARIRSADDGRMLYLNLLPNYVSPRDLHSETYADYVRRFIDEVGLGMVSFDNYPVLADRVRPEFWANLEVVAAESRRAGIPFWAFALSTAHDPYPVATRASLRLQIFGNLAYGAQGIQYFTYTTPGTETWNFHNAPIDERGRRTEVYDLVRELNREVHALTRVFLGAEVISTGHTGAAIPDGTHRLGRLPRWVSRVDSDGDGLLVSHLRNGGYEYLMIVNRDLYHPQRVTVAVDDDAERVLPDGSACAASAYSTELNVGEGDMLLFRRRTDQAARRRR